MISHRATESTEVELERINSISERVIGCAIEVHKQLGPGLLESIYESALVELELAGLQYQQQVPASVSYKGHLIDDLRLDLLVENLVVIEIKSVERIEPVFEAQVLSYLKLSGKRLGLLIQFQQSLSKNRHSEIHSLSLPLVLLFLDSYPFVHGVFSLCSLCLCG
jgi:GxxExxY protein